MTNKKRVVINAGIYDLLHEGHMSLLRRMREKADILVIIVHDDASCFRIKDKVPIQDIDTRIKNLRITCIPDIILVTDRTDPAETFEKAVSMFRDQDVVYMRGDDLTDDFPGKWMLDDLGVPIEFLPYTQGISSSQIRKRLWS